MKSTIKQWVRAKHPIAGCFISIPHPASVEACAVSGIDFICIDAEHSAVGRETLENMIRAAECVQLPALVRVPDAKSGWIGWALDSGADGIIVPRVETEEDAQLIVKAAYYSPKGSRGLGLRVVQAMAPRYSLILNMPMIAPALSCKLKPWRAYATLRKLLTFQV